ncbi:MAG: septation protein IspZ, partial [Gammaproteobacteria bacterium]|nr:septation protein IspZ [Gammaproteobacteria bacterium]
MKQIIDFLPVVAFFGVWLATGRDIYYATAALMGAAVIQLAVFKL